MANNDSGKRIVFVGGGHAHLYSLKYADRFVREGAEVLVIGPARFHYYSGMGPGMLSRIYEPDQLQFDIPRMVQSRQGTFIQGKVASVQADNRTLVLEGGEEISYDLVSFNVGSYVPMHLIPGAEEEAFPVKPIENLESVRETILDKIKGGTPRILVVGGGPAGVELSGNIWRLVHDHHGRAEIILANSTDRLLPNAPEKATRLAEQSLSERGIQIRSHFLAESMRGGVARSNTGQQIRYDVAVLTIGIVPPRIFADSGLEAATDGALLVNDYLQSVRHPEIFGGGDCIAIEGRPLSRVGVYAVREAPILFHNLLASLRGEPLKVFTPQERFLLIFNLGDGSGLLVRGSFVWKGRLAFTWKSYIDTKFVSKFQVP